MATGSVPITAGSGTPIRIVTNAAVDSGADQQVMTLADSAGNLLGTTAAPVPVSIAGSGGQASSSATLSAAATNTPGTAVTASTTAQLVTNVSAAGNVTFHLVTSAFVGTVVFEGSVDGGLNYGSLFAIREDGTGSDSTLAINTAAAFNRIYTAALPGLMYFRIRVSAFTSGTLAVLVAPGPTLVEPNPSLAGGTQYIGQVRLTDGTNNPAVKAASVAAVAADPSLVVAHSPNSPTPVGANLIGSVGIGSTTLSAFTQVTTASTNATLIKSSPATLHNLTISNPVGSAMWVKLYNKATAPTVGTDVPVVTLRIPSSGTAGDTVVYNPGVNGARFTNGIGLAVTGAAIASDTTATVAGVQIFGTFV